MLSLGIRYINAYFIMKVLHLTCWYPTTEKPNYGSFIRSHADAIANHTNNKVEESVLLAVICLYGNNLLEKTEREENIGSLRIHVLEIRSRFWKLFYHSPRWISGLMFRLLKQYFPNFKPDLIHAHVGFPCGVAANRIAKKLKIPFLVTEHWSGTIKQLRQPIFGLWTRNTYRKAKAVTAVSNSLLNDLKEAHLLVNKPKWATQVIANCLDAEFSYHRKKEPNNTLLMIMNLADRKRPDLVVDAMVLLKQKWPVGYKVLIVGNGPYKVNLQEKVKQNNLEVTFQEAVQKSEVPGLLKMARCLLLPTEVETFGLIVVEALACGTPALVSDIPNLAVLVNEHSGAIVPNTVKDWEDAIEKMLTTEYECESVAKEYKQRFGPEGIGNQFVDLYNQILPN